MTCTIMMFENFEGNMFTTNFGRLITIFGLVSICIGIYGLQDFVNDYVEKISYILGASFTFSVMLNITKKVNQLMV